MHSSRGESGFTLVELVVVVGVIAVGVATFGAFFLAGPSPAVAAAEHDISAVFDEARATAIAYDAATVAFTPTGAGYSARVYRAAPGDSGFRAVNGPTYESTVAISETAAPLGAPAFAFRVDHHGNVTGYPHYHPGDAAFTQTDCPATGAFTLALLRGRQQRTIPVPCTLAASSATVAIATTPSPAASPSPYAPGTCPGTQNCGAPLPPYNATCPPGYTQDPQPYTCDAPTPSPTMTRTPDIIHLSGSPSSAPSTSPSTPSTSNTPGAALVSRSWNFQADMICDTQPHGGALCGWNHGGLIASFEAATNTIQVTLNDTLSGSHEIDTGSMSARAQILLIGPNNVSYCLSQAFAHSATGLSVSTSPGFPAFVKLPDGAGVYSIDVQGLSESVTTDSRPAPISISLTGSINILAASADSSTALLTSPCPTNSESGV